MDFYKLIWRPVRRPLTYATRAAMRAAPLAFMLAAFGAGALTRYLTTRELLLTVFALLIGVVWGHIGWDTRGAYIKEPISAHNEDNS